jgi:hypothetical protein
LIQVRPIDTLKSFCKIVLEVPVSFLCAASGSWGVLFVQVESPLELETFTPKELAEYIQQVRVQQNHALD